MNRFLKLPEISKERENELGELENEFNLKFPKEFKDFFVYYELNDFKLSPKKGLAYKSDRIKEYYTDNILISHFCSKQEMLNWYEMFFPIGFSNGEGIQVVTSYGSAFIVLIANEGSPNYGKVMYYDLEMAPDQIFVLGDTFNEFLSYITEI
jgi:SMI1 / KNR4 family (SUKH-1)